MKSKYWVTCEKDVSISEIDELVSTDYSSQTVPDRNVEIVGELVNSTRVSVYLLNEQEAENLKQHSKIKNVELHEDERTDIFCKHNKIDTHNYKRGSFDSSLDFANYGLLRHTSREEFLYNTSGNVNTGLNDKYIYNNAGEGVDIFIIDSGVQADHPDFLDSNGVTRVQKIDWKPYITATYPYFFTTQTQSQLFANLKLDAHKIENYYQEQQGFHGTQCASIAAGNRYGFAKKAHIYSCKGKSGFDNQHSPTYTNWLSIIKEFITQQRAAGINRPAIINSSYGFVTQGWSLDDVISGSYADENTSRAEWTRGNKTNDQLRADYRLISTIYNQPNLVQSKNLDSIDALAEELSAMNVHLVKSAGNESHRIVPTTDVEFDNYIVVSESGVNRQIYYNRAGSPVAESSIVAGALGANETNNQEQIAFYSNRGKRVDVVAAASLSFCAISKFATNYDNQRAHPDDANQYIGTFSGTSCAAPQTAGVAALHLSAKPYMKPKELRQKIIDDATDDILITGSDYTQSNQLHDTPNRILYSIYNQDQSITSSGAFTMSNVNLSQNYKYVSKFNVDDGIFHKKGILPDTIETDRGFWLNNNTSNVYADSTVRYIVYQAFYSYLECEIFFDANPEYMRNHNWNTLEIYTQNTKKYIKLRREDAVFNPIKQSFFWSVSTFGGTNNNMNLLMQRSETGAEPLNAIGIR